MRAVAVIGVVVDLPSPHPVLVLRETDGQERELRIPIGFPEATAIAAALRGLAWPRPVTQQLLADVLSELGVVLEQAVISAVRERTFYAHLDLLQGERRIVVSCRPSDAVGLILRLPGGSPLLVVDEVMEREGVATVPPVPDGPDLATGEPPGPGSGPDDHGLLVGGSHEQGEQDVVGHEGGAAVGDEGQGHAGDGQEPDDARHDEEGLDAEGGGESGHQELGEVRPGP